MNDPHERRAVKEVRLVTQHRVLHAVVERVLSRERRRRVHLDEPRAQRGVDQHVVPEQLEGTRLRTHLVVHDHQRLDDQQTDAPPQRVAVDPVEPPQQRPQPVAAEKRDLGPADVLVLCVSLRAAQRVVRRDLRRVVLLDRAVGQVDELVVHVARAQRVRLRAHAREAVAVHERLERAERRDHHVDAQVELVVRETERPLDVLLHDGRLAVRELVEALQERDAAPAGETHGLEDPVVVQRRRAVRVSGRNVCFRLVLVCLVSLVVC